MPVVTCKVSTSTGQSVDARANILQLPLRWDHRAKETTEETMTMTTTMRAEILTC